MKAEFGYTSDDARKVFRRCLSDCCDAQNMEDAEPNLEIEGKLPRDGEKSF